VLARGKAQWSAFSRTPTPGHPKRSVMRVPLLASAALLLAGSTAWAAEPASREPAEPAPPPPPKHQEFDYDTPSFEPAAFPLLGGDSDIGVEIGAVTTLSKLGHGVRPYEWNMDLLVSVSVKSGPSGSLELTQQNYLWDIDVPGLYGGALRLNPTVSYTSTINEGYWSLGNASSAQRPANLADPGRYFEYTDRVAMARELTRIRLRPPIDLMISTNYRFESPEAYPGSKLALDAAAGRVIGLEPLSLAQLGAGILYDSRDNEYFPRDGSFHQIGVRYVQGIPFDAGVHYGALGAIFAFYRSIGGPFVLAWRALLDAEAGRVPFYDLFMGEPFAQDQIIGGSAGVRGVPEGRYLGELKVIGNIELRAMLLDFRLFGQAMHLGGNLLFDTGRTWLNYTFSAAQDGSGLGLKWGAGGGIYLRWGQAGLFRMEAAYSPDALAESRSFPIGLYVEDGVMF
jgi:outer membrane protein assembly factor BamA